MSHAARISSAFIANAVIMKSCNALADFIGA